MTTAGAGTARRTTGTAQTKYEQARTARLNATMLKIVGVVLLVSVVLYVTGMARVRAGSKSINALRAQIAAEESRRQQLEIALYERQNLEMIGDLAVSRLGMVRPGASDVRVVSLAGELSGGDAQTVYDATGDSAP